MTSIYETKISTEVRLIHAKQMSIYNFIILRKKQWAQMKTKHLKQDILNQYDYSSSFLDIHWLYNDNTESIYLTLSKTVITTHP